jgi:hypothetical protein
MKTLKLNNRWQIQTDRDNYILQKLFIVKDKKSKNVGKERVQNVGYYSSLKSLIQAVGEQEIRDGIDNLTQVQKSLEELKNTVKTLNLTEVL